MNLRTIILSALILAGGASAQTTPASLSPADLAWNALQAGYRASSQPPANATKAQVDQIKADNIARLRTASNQAKVFYTKYPGDPRAPGAQAIEITALLQAARAGDVANEAVAQRMARAFRDDQSNAVDARFEVTSTLYQVEALRKPAKSLKDVLDIAEANAQQLLVDFPSQGGTYRMFLGIAQNGEPDRANRIANLLLKMPAQPDVKSAAQTILDRQDMLTKPAAWQWATGTSKDFKITDYKGQMVVVFGWASWVVPSLDAYKVVQQQASVAGAVFVSANFDTDLNAAATAVAARGISGTYFTDARGLDGAIAAQLKLPYLPCVYVVAANGKIVGYDYPAGLAALLAKGH